MHRWTLDLHSGRTNERPLDDVSTEYPRVAEHRTGLHNGFVYTTTFSLQATPDHSEILRYDLDDDGSVTRHRLPRGHTCGEPVFVGRSAHAGEDVEASIGEDEGVVLSWVHDRAADSSYLAILDATDLTAEPLAEVHVPRRVPNGFHGTWVSSD